MGRSSAFRPAALPLVPVPHLGAPTVPIRRDARARLRPGDTVIAGHLVITYGDPNAALPDQAAPPDAAAEGSAYDLDATILEQTEGPDAVSGRKRPRCSALPAMD